MGNLAKTYAALSNQELALKLMDWHSSGGDPIYAVGSFLYGNHVDEILPETFRDCVFNLRKVEKGYPYYRQAWALANEVERRFADRMVTKQLDDVSWEEEDRMIAALEWSDEEMP